MDIGEKLKAARMKKGMTQEQVAESLGVSRQTISNWENNRFYPDITNVLRMSDLYSVSLDILLKPDSGFSDVSAGIQPVSEKKEESVMANNYAEYLAESTDLVRSRNRLAKTVQIGLYLFVWAICALLLYIFGTLMPNAGYHDAVGNAGRMAMLIFYLILPVTAMVVMFLIGSDGCWGKYKLLPLLFITVMYVIALVIANDAVARNQVELFPALLTLESLGMLLLNFILSLAGLLLGERTLKKHGNS